MPFDPNLPQPNTPADADQMRAQLNGLKDLIDALTAQLAAAEGRLTNLESAGFVTQGDIDNAIAGTASNVNGVSILDPFVASDPPLQSEVQMLGDKLNELITGAHR